jgi:hypothetical protein
VPKVLSFKSAVADGIIDVQPVPGGSQWIVTFSPYDEQRKTGGPWTSAGYPDMPVGNPDDEGYSEEATATAIRNWWVDTFLSERVAEAQGEARELGFHLAIDRDNDRWEAVAHRLNEGAAPVPAFLTYAATKVEAAVNGLEVLRRGEPWPEPSS